MPRRKSVMSLKECCLTNIAYNMDSYWCSEYKSFTAHSLNQGRGRTLYLLGPFDSFPACLVEELMDTLREKKKLKRPHLEFLLHSSLKHLNLSGWQGPLGSVIASLQWKCQRITHLDLSGCKKMSQAEYAQLVRSIPNVTSLNLRSTNCSDDVLGQIGVFCKQLRELDVSGCVVTDKGVFALCLDNETGDGDVPRNLPLRKFSVMCPNVTIKGAICCLKNLPNLEEFQHLNSLGALGQLHSRDFLDGRLDLVPKYNLSFLICDGAVEVNLSTAALEIASVLCPNVNSLLLLTVNMTDENFRLLTRFDRLEELHLGSGCAGCWPNFYDGFLQFFRVRGTQLKMLYLESVPLVDIRVIGKFCPNLTSLCFFLVSAFVDGSNATGTTTPTTCPQFFAQLVSLSIILEDGGDVSESDLILLLSHCTALDNFSLHNNATFTDGLLEAILAVNPLAALKNVELDYCSGITGWTMEKLLTSNNSLCSLKCLHCVNVTIDDFHRCERYIQEKNFDASIEWQ